jgi:tetratricopeptide (TPR) repeat protein
MRCPVALLSTALLAGCLYVSADQKADLAEGFYRKAVKAADELATPDEIAQRNALVSGGYFYLGQNRPKEALPWLERAVKISEQSVRFRRTLHAIDLDNLGLAYSNQGRYAEGRALGLRALKVLDGAQAESDAAKTRGVVLHNLAYGYMEERRYAEAETNYRRALEILAPSAAPQVGETWRVKVVLTNYAALLRKLGREQEAATLERRKQQLPAR